MSKYGKFIDGNEAKTRFIILSFIFREFCFGNFMLFFFLSISLELYILRNN
jgi:hypothetical protein